MTTIAEKTEHYNRLATELGLPTVKRLRKSKTQSVDERLSWIANEYSRLNSIYIEPIIIKPTKPGTILYYIIEELLEGATLLELALKFESVSPSSLRATINDTIKQKGYIVDRLPSEKGTIYLISNSDKVW